jgi:hypothetical protein
VDIGDTSNYHGWKFLKTHSPRVMLKHFKKGFSEDYGIKMSPGRPCTFCELEWPTFGANWPPEDTLDLPTVRAIYQIKRETPGYPSQFPYYQLLASGSSDHVLLGLILCQQKGVEQSFHGPDNDA